MKIQKEKLAQKINKLKGAVPKKASHPVLQGILVADGYLIANNLEMTIKTKTEEATGETFIIPERAFDLIGSLPEGELEISAAAKDAIMIKADRIKNKYQTMNPEQFPVTEAQGDDSEAAIKADTLLEAIKHVSYAVPA